MPARNAGLGFGRELKLIVAISSQSDGLIAMTSGQNLLPGAAQGDGISAL
jgi:hypothetical protein